MIPDLNVAGWRQFQIADLFEISRPATRTIKNYDTGSIPLVAAGRKNNGIVDYVTPKFGEVLDPANSIVVSPLDGYASFQKEAFLGLGGSGSAPIILSNDRLDESTGLFLCAVISKRCTHWSFKDKGSSRKIREYDLLLPSDDHGTPDWKFMVSYMERIRQAASEQGERVRQVQNIDSPVSSSDWGEFVLGDIASVDKGRRLRKRDMLDGDFPHIGASASNNGVTRTLGNSSALFEGNCITVAYDGSIGESFYQAEPFWASDAVNIVRVHENIDRYSYLFLAAIMRATGKRYKYTDKWGSEKMRKEAIRLPRTSDGQPDWNYMSTKMQIQIATSAKRIGNLSKLSATLA